MIGNELNTRWAVIVMMMVLAAAFGISTDSRAQASADWGHKWTADGELVLPSGFHEWVYLGSPLTPHALNGGEAPFPEDHNVYV